MVSQRVDKLIATAIAACFLFSLVLAEPLKAAQELMAGQGAGSLFADESLPPTWGRVSSSRLSKGDPTVIIIQDLHCNPEVQRNISQILTFIDRRYRLGRVWVEGAAGTPDVSWLAGLRDGELRRSLADTLLAQGKLTGSEYYAVAADKPHFLNGLEDEALYRANLARLGRIIRSQDRLKTIESAWRRELAPAEDRSLGDMNRRLGELVSRYRAGEVPAKKFYRILFVTARVLSREKSGVPAPAPEDYPALREYLQLTGSSDIDFAVAGRQLQRYMRLLKERLPYLEYRELLAQTGNLTAYDRLYGVLPRLEERLGLANGNGFAELAKFIAYLRLNGRINPLAVNREEKRLVAELRSAACRDEREREVVFLQDFLPMLEDYLGNRVSAEDCAAVRAGLERFRLLWIKHTGNDPLSGLGDTLTLLNDYYSTNIRRNAVFLEKIRPATRAAGTRLGDGKSGLPPAGEEVTVLISGGFHADGMERALREANIPFATITPNATRDNEPYARIYDEIARHQALVLGQAFGIYLLSNEGSAAHDLQVEGLLGALVMQEAGKIGARPFAEKALETVMRRTGGSLPELQNAADEVARVFNDSLHPATGCRVFRPLVDLKDDGTTIRFSVQDDRTKVARTVEFFRDASGAVTFSGTREEARIADQDLGTEDVRHDIRRDILAEQIRRNDVFRVDARGGVSREAFRVEKFVTRLERAWYLAARLPLDPLVRAASLPSLLREMRRSVVPGLERARTCFDDPSFIRSSIGVDQLDAIDAYLSALVPLDDPWFDQRQRIWAARGDPEARRNAVVDALVAVARTTDVLIVKDRFLLHEYGPVAHARRGLSSRGDTAVWLGEKLFSAPGVSDRDRALLLLEEAKHILAPGLGHDVLRHEEALSRRLDLAARRLGETPGSLWCGSDLAQSGRALELLKDHFKDGNNLRNVRPDLDALLKDFPLKERLKAFLDFFVEDWSFRDYVRRQTGYGTTNSCLEYFTQIAENGILDTYYPDVRETVYGIIMETENGTDFLQRSFIRESDPIVRGMIVRHLKPRFKTLEDALQNLFPNKTGEIAQLKKYIPQISTLGVDEIDKSVFMHTDGFDRLLGQLAASREEIGPQAFRAIVRKWERPTDFGMIMPFDRGEFRVKQNGYYLPFPVDPDAPVKPANANGFLIVRNFPVDPEQRELMQRLFMIYKDDFLGANFAALELIAENAHAMTKGTALQILEYTERMVILLQTLDLGSTYRSRRAFQVLERLRASLESEWGGLQDIDLLPADLTKKICDIHPQNYYESIDTVQTLINALHTDGNDALQVLFSANSADTGISCGDQKIFVADIGNRPLFSGSHANSRALKALLPLFSPARKYSPGASVVIMDDFVSWSCKLGKHRVELMANLCAPDDGGFIRLRFYEELREGFGRVEFMEKVLTEFGFSVKQFTGGDCMIDAVIDKDNGSRDVDQMESILSAVIYMFVLSRNLDLALAHGFPDNHLGELASLYCGEGTLLGFDFNSYFDLFKALKAYQAPALAAQRDTLRRLMDNKLQEWGLPPIPSYASFGQETIDRYFTRPVKEALISGKLEMDADGQPRLSLRYHPVEDLLAAVTADEETAIQTGLMLNALPNGLLTYQPVGYVGKLMAVSGQTELGDSGYLVVNGLIDNFTGRILYATCVLKNEGIPETRLTGEGLVQLFAANGYRVPQVEKPAPLQQNAAHDALSARIDSRISRGVVAWGLAASAGDGSWVAGRGSFSRKNGHIGGAAPVFVAPFTTPDDLDAIQNAAAVVTTGGGVLSHAGITTRELGIPSVILPRARWNGAGKDQAVAVTLSEPGGWTRRVDYWTSDEVISRNVSLREDDIVLVHGKSGRVAFFAAESQPLLNEAFDRVTKVLHGETGPETLYDWVRETASDEGRHAALADAIELMLTLAAEHGFQPGQEGRHVIELLLSLGEDAALPPMIADTVTTFRERYLLQRLNHWNDSLAAAGREMQTDPTARRLEVLSVHLEDELAAIEQLAVLLGMYTEDSGTSRNKLADFQEKARLRELEIIDRVREQASLLAGRELTVSDLPEVRRVLRLAEQNGLREHWTVSDSDARALDALLRAGHDLETRKRSYIEGYDRDLYALGLIDEDYIGAVGGKSARLGEIAAAVRGLDAYVPRGISLTTNAFTRFLKESGIEGGFNAMCAELDALLSLPASTEESRQRIIEDYSRKLRELIASGTLAEDDGMGKEIMEAVAAHGMGRSVFAVRSSAVQEDTEIAAYAGAAETSLYVSRNELLERIKENWASFFLVRGIQYRYKQGASQSTVQPAVLVQEMVDSDVAGVMSTVDPVNGYGEVVINANYGLGESVVSGKVQSDLYRAGKSDGEETDFPLIGSKRMKIVRKDGRTGTETVMMKESDRKNRCLSRPLVKRLTEIAVALEKHFGYPLDIEFAVVKGRIAVLQVRPLTALGFRSSVRAQPAGGIMQWLLERYVRAHERAWRAKHGNLSSPAELRLLRARWADEYAQKAAPWKENLGSFLAGGVVSGVLFGIVFLATGAFNFPLFLLAAYTASWPVFTAGHFLTGARGMRTPGENRKFAGFIAAAGLISAAAALPLFSSVLGAVVATTVLEAGFIGLHRLLNRSLADRRAGSVAGTGGSLRLLRDVLQPFGSPAGFIRHLAKTVIGAWKQSRLYIQYPELRGKAVVNVHAEGDQSALSARLTAEGVNAVDITLDRGQNGTWFGWILVDGKLAGVRKDPALPVLYVSRGPAADPLLTDTDFVGKAAAALLAELSGSRTAARRLFAGFSPAVIIADASVMPVLQQSRPEAGGPMEDAVYAIRGVNGAEAGRNAYLDETFEQGDVVHRLRYLCQMIRREQARGIAVRSELAARMGNDAFGLLTSNAVARLAAEINRNRVPRLVLHGDPGTSAAAKIQMLHEKNVEAVFEYPMTDGVPQAVTALQAAAARGFDEVILDLTATEWKDAGELRRFLKDIATALPDTPVKLRTAEGVQHRMRIGGTPQEVFDDTLLDGVEGMVVPETRPYREISLERLGETLPLLLSQQASDFAARFKAEISRTLNLVPADPRLAYEEVWRYDEADIPPASDELIACAARLAGEPDRAEEILGDAGIALDPDMLAGRELASLLARFKTSNGAVRTGQAQRTALYIRALAERMLYLRETTVKSVRPKGLVASLRAFFMHPAESGAGLARFADRRQYGSLLLLRESMGGEVRARAELVKNALTAGDEEEIATIRDAVVRKMVLDLKRKTAALNAVEFGLLRDRYAAVLYRKAEMREPDAVSALLAVLQVYGERKTAARVERPVDILNIQSVRAALAAA